VARPVNLKLCLNLILNLTEENTCNEPYYVLFSESESGDLKFDKLKFGDLKFGEMVIKEPILF